MDKGVKIIRWCVFTVIFGLMPLAVRYLNSRTTQTPLVAAEVLKTGELFIVGAVIAADAIGKALSSKHQVPIKKELGFHLITIARIVSTCACIALLFVASVEFAQVSGRIDAHLPYNELNAVHDSLYVFGCIVAAGVGVILLAEEE